ncbi:hypothetical protein DPMN_086250 [Dreissena polymorpha]|uniref:Uncharacterized protein n=1 Tax=Dreissena polymorpha TaxID=45954 RepID=A0A9D3YIH2_DREPO|nr:hypothetical protein DPMN_086250 [Dreissena polymorpha]
MPSHKLFWPMSISIKYVRALICDKYEAKQCTTYEFLAKLTPGRVYRKLVNEGLATAYSAKGDKFLFLRKLMSLPYMPCEHIVPAFEQLKLQAEEVGGPILNVVMYMQRTWIRGSMWTPDNWSVYRQTVRTNNDVEGRPDLGFYVLLRYLSQQ